MNTQFMLDSVPAFWRAALLTLQVFGLGVFFAGVAGFICAIVVFFRLKILSKIAAAYIEFARNTPLIIQLFFLYYGLGRWGLQLSSFTCTVLGLAFLGGGYLAESFKSGFDAVSRQQFEAGLSLGLSESQNFLYIILPQSLAVAMPSISANLIFLFKETSVVSIIALPDLVHTMSAINAITYKTDELLLMLFLAYLAIILPMSLFLGFLEKKFRHA